MLGKTSACDAVGEEESHRLVDVARAQLHAASEKAPVEQPVRCNQPVRQTAERVAAESSVDLPICERAARA